MSANNGSGPVQVLVLGFDEPQFDGTLLAELAKLREAGIVRLVDLLAVTRSEDGSLETIDLDGYGEIAGALLGGGDGPAPEVDSWSLDVVVPTSGTVVVALIEHLWAGPLSSAIAAAGGQSVEETWLSSADRALLARLEGR